MPNYSAGSASVDIKPNFQGFVRDLRRDLDRVRAELAVDVTPDLSGFAQRLRRDLDRVQAELSVDITPDLSGFAQRLSTELSRINAEVSVKVDVDERSLTQMEGRIRARLAAMDLTATIRLDADTAVAARDIEMLRTLAGGPMTIDVDADTSAAAAQIAALRAASASGGGGRGMSAGMITGGANLGALAIANLPAMATGLAAVGAELQTLLQSATLLPGIMVGAAAGISTLVVGFQNMGDAFSDSPEKAAEAMAKLSASARETVQLVRGYSDEWSQVQRNVQSNLFEGLADPLRQMIDAQLPIIDAGMSRVATRFGEGMQLAVGELGNEWSQGGMDQLFRNTDSAVGNLNKSIKPLMASLRTIAVTGSNFLPGMADGFSDLAVRFGEFIHQADLSGDLARWMREGADAAEALGSTVGNLGSSLNSIFRAVKGDGDGLLVTLDNLTGRMADWLGSDVGQSQMREFFVQGREQLAQWEPILQNIGTFLKSVYEASQAWASILMPFLQAASSLLAGNETAVQSLLVAWLAYRTIGPILTGLIAQIVAFRVASAAAATAGAGALGRTAAGLGAVLGGAGPLGIGLAAAAIGLGFLAVKHNEAKQAADEQKRALEALGETLDKQSGKATEATISQAAGMLEEGGFLGRAESFGVNTKDYVRASIGLDPNAKGAINEQLTQVILSERGSAGTTWDRASEVTGLSNETIAQALQGVPEAVTAYADAIAEAQLNQEGGFLPTLADLKDGLNDTGESAATLGGEMNHTDSQTAKLGETLRRTNEAINGTHQLTEEGRLGFEALGLAVQSVPDAKTIFVESTTEEQQRKLEELGYTVQHMPDGSVKITLNDEQARAQIQEIVQPATKTVTVTLKEAKAALGPYAGLYNPAPGEGFADGGIVTGGIPGRDSVPIMAMADEVVFDRPAVAALGGPEAADRFRRGLRSGRIRGYADGGIVHPQAALPGRMTDEEIERLNAQARVDQANTDRNRVYADPASTQEQKSSADREYASAQNALEKQASSSGSGEDGSLPSQYSAQGIGARAGAILGQGILSFFGLENSILSDTNVYNKAFHDVQDFYSDKEKEKSGQAQPAEGYGYQPQNLATDQTDTAADAEREAKKQSKSSGENSEASGEDQEYVAGGGVEQWRGTFLGVLSSLGMPESWIGLGLQQMQSESGGNPAAINNWDSNAAAGTPSKGLMQVIDPTFQSYRSPAYPNDIWNPGANIAAALQYLVARYGGPEGVWGEGHGYDLGGIAMGLGLMPKHTIKPERVLSPRQTEAFESMLPVMESISSSIQAPPLPAGLTPRGGDVRNVTHDRSVNFQSVSTLDVDQLMRETDRWSAFQAQGDMAALP